MLKSISRVAGMGAVVLALGACEEGRVVSGSFPGATVLPVRASSGGVETFSDADFTRQVLASPRPVLVDCWAPWCGPCRGMEPTVAALAEEWGGTIRVGKLDVTTNPVAARRYGLNSLPAFLVFKNGVVVKRVVGYQAKQNLKGIVEGAVR